MSLRTGCEKILSMLNAMSSRKERVDDLVLFGHNHHSKAERGELDAIKVNRRDMHD